jgi:hypothetical protein
LAGDLESVAHTRQQPVELLVAQLNLVGEELADARLAYAAEARQFGLGGAGLAHHRPQYLTPVAHIATIAVGAIGSFEAKSTTLCSIAQSAASTTRRTGVRSPVPSSANT